MSEENVVMNLTANADFSNLVTSVNRVTASLLKMQEQIGASNRILTGQIAQINKAFSDTLRQTGQFGTHFVTLTDDVEKFGSNLDKGQLKLRDYYTAWNNHARTSGGLVRQLAQQQVQLQNAILQPLGKNAQGLMQFNVQVPKGLDVVKNRAALATQELKIMNKVMQEGANQLINWGKNTQWAGRQLTVGLTVPLAAFGASASKAFREADQELVRLTKVYGGVAATSTKELQQIRKEVEATANVLAKKYGASYKETISLAADLAATGKQGNDLLKATSETTRLMVLGEVDRQQAMKTTLTLQSTFKENTTQLADSINFLNAVENQTSLTIQDLTEAIPKAGPVIKALGGNVKDLSLYLTAMKEGGIGAAEGANAIKSAFASLINPTQKATDMFRSFGIDLKGMVARDTGNTTQLLLDLQAALDKLDPLSKSKAIEQLFGKFQFARISALMANLGRQGSQSLQVLDLLKQSTGDIAAIADRELKQVTESASGRYKRAVEGLKADLAGIGDQFLKIQTFFINVTDKIVKFVNHLPGPVKSILTFLTGLTAIAGPLIMLTGVMANFIGWVIKGAFHFKALFKSGEGWRLLTPEILAAQKAGTLIESTFYSDAKAALALAEALSVLESGYGNLEKRINQGVVTVQPTISTIAGSIVVPGAGGAREVDPTNPLVGQKGTRASAHINPVRGRTQAQIDASTIYGFVPAAIPVNNAIKDTPQIYTTGDLPAVPGLTTASSKHGQVSTGIVAGEAAKWHTLMGTMSMMSKTEVDAMKKEIAATGTVSTDFMTAYSSLLPEITKISEKAATDSAAIVAQVKAGELSLAQAKEKLIQLNYEIEAAMGSATTNIATSLGRTANLTSVPGLNQPVVDQSGKSNMRQLFGKGNASWLDKLAGIFGVKTWGASYSTETTRPKRLNSGGRVYDPSRDGNIVPGDTSINYDNTPARLRAGGFILNQDASKNNPDLVQLTKNQYGVGGQIVSALLTPGETYFPPELASQIMPTLEKANSGARISLKALGGLISPSKTNYGLKVPRVIAEAAAIRELFPGLLSSKHGKSSYEVKGTQGSFGGAITDSRIVEAMRSELGIKGNSITRSKINKLMEKDGVPPDILLASIYSGRGNYRLSTDVLLEGLMNSGIISAEERQALSDVIFQRYAKDLATLNKVNDINNPVLESSLRGLTESSLGQQKRILVREALQKFASSPGMVADVGRRSSSGFLQYIELSNGTRINLARLQGKGTGETFYHAPMPSKLLRTLPSNVSEAANARYYQNISNLDPAHGVLQIGRYVPEMSVRNRYIGSRVVYTGTGYEQKMSVPAFELGVNVEEKAKQALYRYMMGDYSGIADPAVQDYLSSIRTKQTGTFFRGIRPGSSGLPNHLDQAIRMAQITGNWSSLIGHEFIMRRSSWSSNRDTAAGFGSVLLTAGVKNRNAVAASQIFPGLKFDSPSGPVSVNENEFYMGGKFKVIGADNGHLQLQAVIDGKRENGGNVYSNKSYLVGEHGPELFVPRNNGGIIPNYALGGLVQSGKSGYGLNPKTAAASFVGKNALGLLAWIVGPQLLQKLGLSSSIVNNLMTAGFVGQMAYGARKVYKGARMAGQGEEVAADVVKAEGALSRFAPTLLKLGTFASRASIPLTVLLTGLTAYQKLEENHKRNQELYAVSFGLTAKTAKEAGIAVKSLDDQLKISSDAANSVKTRAALLFSQDSAGIKGLSLTVGELKKLEQSVKKTMPTYVDAFKKMTGKDIITGAANIKAQWVAMGMSIQDANAKIYTLIKLTHGSQAALSAITSDAFTKITDKASASEYAIKLVGQAIKNINNVGATGAASALDTFFQIQTSKLQALQDKASKDGNANPNTSAYTETMAAYAKSGYGNVKITRDMINELSKTQPILSTILNATDTIGSSMSKWIIATSGSIPNLEKIANLTESQANTVAKAIVLIQDASNKALSSDRLAGAKERQLAQQQKALIKASAASAGMNVVDQVATKNRIKLLEDEIKKINEAAAARKKAMEQQQQDADTLTQIQKKQLEYQQALAAGDMAAASQAQLDIQQLTQNRQLDIAKNAIDTGASNRTTPLQQQVDDLNAKLNASADAQTIAADSMDKLSKSINDLIAKDTSLKSSLQRAIEDKRLFGADSSTFKNDLKVLLDDYAALTGLKKSANGVYTDSSGKTITAEGLYAALEKSTLSNINLSGQTVIVTAGELLTGKNLYGNNPLGALGTPKSSAITGNEKRPTGQQNPNIPYSPPKNPSDKTGQSGIDAIHNPLLEKYKYKKNSAGFYQLSSDPLAAAPRNLVGVSGDYYYGPNGSVYLANDKTQFVGRWFSITGSGQVAYSSGGKVNGPGTGTSDSIPAFLSNGEYVIRASAAKRYGSGFLHAINTENLHSIRNVPQFKNGININSVGNLSNPNTFIPSSNNATMGAVFNITNNITAAPGMDTEILAMRVVDMTKKALAADTIVSSSKVGPNKEFGSRVMA